MPALPSSPLETASSHFYKIVMTNRSLPQLYPPPDILFANVSGLSLSQAELILAIVADGLPGAVHGHRGAVEFTAPVDAGFVATSVPLNGLPFALSHI